MKNNNLAEVIEDINNSKNISESEKVNLIYRLVQEHYYTTDEIIKFLIYCNIDLNKRLNNNQIKIV